MDRVVELINKETMSIDDRLELLDELYWADFSKLKSDYPEGINKILLFLREEDFSIEEISLIQKLYANPEGAYVEEFGEIIINLYKGNKTKFIKALHLNFDEAENLSYLFRNNKVFQDGDTELREILTTNGLTMEEEETANSFFKMYKKVCNT